MLEGRDSTTSGVSTASWNRKCRQKEGEATSVRPPAAVRQSGFGGLSYRH